MVLTDGIRIVTDLKLDRSLIGRLNSKVKVSTWAIDPKSNSFFNPRTDELQVPRRFPTDHFKERELPSVKNMLDEKLSWMREMIKHDYGIILEKKKKLLAKKNPETKEAKKKLEEITELECAIKNLERSITYDGYFQTGNRFVYVIKTPFLTDNQLAYLNDIYHHNKRFTKSTDLVKQDMNYLFHELYFQNGQSVPTGGQFSTKISNTILSQETFINSSICSLDFETTDWNVLTVSSEDRLLSSLELIKRYELAETNEEKEIIGDLTKDQLLDLVREKKNSLRKEQIVVGTLCSASSVKDIINGDWSDVKFQLISSLPLMKSMSVQVPTSEQFIEPELYQENNQKDLLKTKSALIQEINPFIVTGQNYLTFDYGKPRELGLEFKVGINEELPEYKWRLMNDFVKIRVTPGRMDIDSMLFYQHYSPWTINNKLDIIFQDLTGFLEKKELNYVELEDTIQTILKDDSISFDQKAKIGTLLHTYAMRDSMKSLLNGALLVPEVSEMAFLYGTTFARVCSTDKKRLSEEYWNRRSIEETLTFRYKDPRNEFLEKTPALKKIFNYNENKKSKIPGIKWEDFKAEEFNERLMKFHSFQNSKSILLGTQKCRIIYLHPHVTALKDFFINDDNALRIFEQGFDNRKKRIRGFKALEAIIEYPMFKIMDYAKPKLTYLMKDMGDEHIEWKFSKEFYLKENSNNLQKYHNNMVIYYKNLEKGFQNETIMNSYRNFLLVKESDTIDEVCKKLEEYNFGTVMGTVDAISIDKNIFAAALDSQLINFGFADPGSNKGKKNKVIKDSMKIILDKLLLEKDVSEAFKSVRNLSWGIQNHLVEPEMLQYKIEKTKKNFSDYSSAATQWYIPLLVQQRMRKGESMIYNPDVEELMEELFGVKMLMYDDKMHYEFTTSKNKKEEKYGHIRKLIEASLPFKDSVKRMKITDRQQNLFGFDMDVTKVLRGVLTGTATDNEINELSALYKKELGW